MAKLHWISAVAATLTIGLAACGTPPAGAGGGPVSGESAAPVSTPTPTPTPSPTPTPTIDPTSLKPGTNHSHAAEAYVYEARDVHAWLVEGPTATNYPDRKIAFLTLDDGPNDQITARALDALRDAGAPATFFYVVNKTGLAGADPALATRTIAEGHSIDVHTYSHNYKTLYPGGRGNAANIIADREKAIDGIRAVLGPDYQVSGYRYPGGHLSWRNMEEADQALADAGAYWIDWNAMNGDAEENAPTTASGMLQMVQSTLTASGKPNVAVILMHDHKYADLTVESLPDVVDYLRSEGYEFGVIN